MWSEQPGPLLRTKAVAAIRSILPAPARPPAGRSILLQAGATPQQLAQLLHHEPGFVWLDGAHSRHMFFRDPLAVIQCAGGEAVVSSSQGVTRFPANSLDLLEAAIEAWPGCKEAMLVGFLSYDVASELETVAPAPSASSLLPRMRFALYDSVLVFDSSGWTLCGTDAWRGCDGLPFAVERETSLLRRAAEASFSLGEAVESFSRGPLLSRPNQQSFLESVDRIVAEIFHGDFFQTNLCRCLEAPFEARLAWALYQRLRTLNPAEYGAFLHLDDDRALLSVSPEMFLKVRRSAVESCPIKGTRSRGRTSEEDRALAADLIGSEKDRAELAMIVDVVRNDLSRVCVPGSVAVAAHASLLTLPTLHHTFSRITGRLGPNTSVVHLLRAAFPAASVTGAPKIAAMQASFREEGQERGPCMGAIGWLALTGDLEMSVAIRTAFTANRRVFYAAGCGITADSNAAAELRESHAKASAYLEALGLAETIETVGSNKAILTL